jgi:hypothetical protein
MIRIMKSMHDTIVDTTDVRVQLFILTRRRYSLLRVAPAYVLIRGMLHLPLL